MKFGLYFVVALLASAFAASFLLADPGYVIINVRGYLIEMSVPVLLALFVLTVAATWLAIKLLRAPRKLGEAAGRYRASRAGAQLTRGVIEMAEGNFAKGERMLARAADSFAKPSSPPPPIARTRMSAEAPVTRTRSSPPCRKSRTSSVVLA